MLFKTSFCTLILTVLLCAQKTHAQSVVSEIELTDVQRMQQLLDTQRIPQRAFFIRSSSRYQDSISTPRKLLQWPAFRLLHAGFMRQVNTDLPITDNDGLLLPAIGQQQRASAGIYMQWFLFSVQVQPEWVVAENRAPAPFTTDPADPNYLSRYYHYIVNKIDLFERIGTDRQERFTRGQSSIRFGWKDISIGISNENLWWGPGRRNSLVLTNTAPGFYHQTIQSRKPIRTPVGSFEFQVIRGQLDTARYESPDHEMMRNFWAGGILEKTNARRGIWGFVFNWNPKWLPGLSLGAAGTEYRYLDSVGVNDTYLLMPSENQPTRARLGALMLRYAMPQEHAEIYAEYGRGNQFASPFNIWSDTIPTAYVLGARKLFPLRSGKLGNMEFSAELTQLQLPDARLIFNSAGIFGIPRTNSWYTHPYITQGYTHGAEALGASIGPGSNAQRIDIAWVKGYKRIAIFGERVARNTDFNYYNYLTGNLGYGYPDRQWVDLHYGAQLRWDWGPLMIMAHWQQTTALNYRWTKLEGGFSEASPSSDRSNTRLQLGLFYQMQRMEGKAFWWWKRR